MYLVASNECFCLQCDIIIGDKPQILIMSLAMNVFVCSMISRYMEWVVHMYLKVCLETPPKEQKLGEMFWEKISFQVGMDMWKVQKQGRGIRKLYSATPRRNDGGLLSGLQCNALASLVHFVVWVTKWTGMQVHCIGCQRGGCHCSVVG